MNIPSINLFEHPVAPSVRATIDSQLSILETVHGVRILYACESGSRGWGFASPDSDYDVRFLYVHPLSWYLQVTPQRDVIEVPISGDLDINGWELRKALTLLKKGNATIIEWLNSPIVYRADPIFLSALQSTATQNHQPERSFHHYLHMAQKNYRDLLGKRTVRFKKYLYVLRPLLAALWIGQGRGIAPMRFQELLDTMVHDPVTQEAIEHLLKIKRACQESNYGRPLPILNRFIDTELDQLKNMPPLETSAIDFSVLDHLLLQTVLQYSPRSSE